MLEILYLAYNRLEFTEFTFQKLLENTNWDLVDKLVVYDDGSVDGTREFLNVMIGEAPVPSEYRFSNFRSPVQTMKHYLAGTEANVFAKVDNDLALSPGWLEAMLSVLDANPELELLGMEPSFMMPPTLDWDGIYTYTPWTHIGGNGLMKVETFKRHPPMDVHGLHGFTGWQWRHEPVRGFITPDLPACLLDRCPAEPWVSLSKKYKHKHWQRGWSKISLAYPYYFSWLEEVTV